METERRKRVDRILAHPKKLHVSNAQIDALRHTIRLPQKKKKRKQSPSKTTKRRFCKYWIHIEDEQKTSLNNLKGIAGEQMVFRWLTERRLVGEKCFGEFEFYQIKHKVGLNIPEQFVKKINWNDYSNQTRKGVDIWMEHPYKGTVAIEVKNWNKKSVGSGINEVKALLTASRNGTKGFLIQTDSTALGTKTLQKLQVKNITIINFGRQIRYGGKGATQTWHDAWIELEKSELRKYLGIYNPQRKLQYDKKIRTETTEWIKQRIKALTP